jgi:putative copper export protein
MLKFTPADIVLWVHVVAACVWIGGQITLGMLIPAAVGQPLIVKAMARRFALLAWIGFAVLVITGLLNMHYAGISFADLGRTKPGRTLGVKLTFVLLSGAAAAVHSWLGSRPNSRAVRGLLGGLSLIFALAAALFGVVLVND